MTMRDDGRATLSLDLAARCRARLDAEILAARQPPAAARSATPGATIPAARLQYPEIFGGG
eukprot:11725149-Heterocapsa_arctica.AAC.1